MELIVGFFLLVALLALFDLAAMHWGVNTRGAGGDFNQRDEFEYYASNNLVY